MFSSVAILTGVVFGVACGGLSDAGLCCWLRWCFMVLWFIDVSGFCVLPVLLL